MIEAKCKSYIESFNIPKYFYLCLFGELVKVFGLGLIEPNEDYLAEYDDDGNVIPSENDDYSYKDQIDCTLTFLGGTNGYNVALKEACKQCCKMDFYEYYNQLDWMFSDHVDGYILDNVVDVLFSKEQPGQYYLHKIGDDNND